MKVYVLSVQMRSGTTIISAHASRQGAEEQVKRVREFLKLADVATRTRSEEDVRAAKLVRDTFAGNWKPNVIQTGTPWGWHFPITELELQD